MNILAKKLDFNIQSCGFFDIQRSASSPKIEKIHSGDQYINGDFVKIVANSASTDSEHDVPVLSPNKTSESMDYHVVDLAVEAADSCFRTWKISEDRRRFLKNILDLLENESQSPWMVYSVADRCDKHDAIKIFKHYLDWKEFGVINGFASQESHQNCIAYKLRHPIGVIGAVVSTKSLYSVLAHIIAPAIICGNTVVIRAAQKDSIKLLRFAELLKTAQLPAGVVNIISCSVRAVSYLVNHPGVHKVIFNILPTLINRIMIIFPGRIFRNRTHSKVSEGGVFAV